MQYQVWLSEVNCRKMKIEKYDGNDRHLLYEGSPTNIEEILVKIRK